MQSFTRRRWGDRAWPRACIFDVCFWDTSRASTASAVSRGEPPSLRDFLGIPASKSTPDHSTISRTRRLLDLETHQAVFTWVLGVLDSAGLIRGKTLGVDGTTLEANAAMKSIMRRDDGRSYEEFLTDLAKTSGIETPTREDLARMDRTWTRAPWWR